MYYAGVIYKDTIKKGTVTTVTCLVEVVSNCWRITGGMNDNDNDRDDNDELGHVSALLTTGIKYTCYGYGQEGHMRRHCLELKIGGRFIGVYLECDKCGYKKGD